MTGFNFRLFSYLTWIVVIAVSSAAAAVAAAVSSQTDQTHWQHSSNFAVLVSSSRYWFNYRHAINALSMYHLLKEQGGYSDDHIILMIADEFAVNPRNPFKNQMYSSSSFIHPSSLFSSLYNETVQIDYRGNDVSVQNLVHALTGRQPSVITQRIPETLATTTLANANHESHILVYWTGHGGDQFFKFQDAEEIMARDIARVFAQMHQQRKYKELLFVADTCQAFTLADAILAASTETAATAKEELLSNILVVTSSLKGESSYAHTSNAQLGLSVTEKYTHAFVTHVMNHLSNEAQFYQKSLQEIMVDPFGYDILQAHMGSSDAACQRKLKDIPFSDYFCDIQAIHPTVFCRHARSKTPSGKDDAHFYGPSNKAPRLYHDPLTFSTTWMDELFHVEQRDSRDDESRSGEECLAFPDEAPLSSNRMGWTIQGAVQPLQKRLLQLSTTPEKNGPSDGSLEPTDPAFVALVTGLLGLVTYFSSITGRRRTKR